MDLTSTDTAGPSLYAAAAPRLRIGVVVASPAIPAWQVDLCAELAGRVVELRILAYPPVETRTAAFQAFNSMCGLQARLLGLCGPCAMVGLDRLAESHRVFKTDRVHGDRPVFAAETTQGLDLIAVMPGSAPPHGEQAVPALGYLGFDRDPVEASLAACARFAGVVEVCLEFISPDGVRSAARCLAANADCLSPAATLACVLAKAKLAPARVVSEFNALGALPACQKPQSPAASLRIHDPLTWSACAAARGIGFFLTGALTQEQWFLTLGRTGDELPRSLRGVRPVYPPKGRGWADPFFFRHGADTWLFFEDIDQATGKGVIAVARLNEDGSLDSPKTVLEEPFHLSYPFIFEHGSDLYMMPESAQAGRLGLYRATSFPHVWTYDRTLIDGAYLVDGTLFEYNERFWLFAGARVPGGSSHDELFLFSGPSPLGPFTPHPKNPIVSDVRRARPAGRVFADGGRIIRPAQDCSGDYGMAVEFREIVTLTETDYAETFAGRLTPSGIGGNVKAHTYERLDDIWAADGLRRVPLSGGG